MSKDLLLNTQLSFNSKHYLYEHLKEGEDTKERGWASKEFTGEPDDKKMFIVIQFALLSSASHPMDGLPLLQHAWDLSRRTIARYKDQMICNLFVKRERIQAPK